MSEPIIKVENLSKKFQIGSKEPYYSLRDSISGLFDFKKKNIADDTDFWALKDVNFEVKKGESIGIIGRNGAGKSTLLKVLSQITPPTTGKITMRGRVASLLEVGTGFNPELTGRENIFLNGAILGMSRAEIKRKFDEIVAFAEIEQFLDTPVKRYSSGMYMRLAFAVAAHLESEILIVDEVLAVGDAQFQEKCLGKMNQVAKNEGRTILFVSHNIAAIRQICSKSMLLNMGSIEDQGENENVIKKYLNRNVRHKNLSLKARKDRTGDGSILITKLSINENRSKSVLSGNPLTISIGYESNVKNAISNVRVVIVVLNEDRVPVLWLDSDLVNKSIPKFIDNNGLIVCQIEKLDLAEGRYFVDINFHINGASVDYLTMAGEFEVKTDSITYGYKFVPQKFMSNYLVNYTFRQ